MPLEYPVDEKSIDRTSAELTGWLEPLARLKQALAKDEFNLFCQPIRSLKDKRYVMGEVLVRMREEEAALLPPGDFFPVFEHYRMMPQLDRWVLRHTIKRLQAGSSLPRFTINLAGQTIDDVGFPGFVAAELAGAGVAASGIAFEIDENDALTRAEACARFAGAVKAIGCGVLLDGFGRKAVSFQPLKALRADFVKVDGSIVRRVVNFEASRRKLQAIVRVADSLHIGVVAECVEDQNLLVHLKALGVGYAQGFGVHPPYPIDDRVAASA
jgi:EAL domain-containing protein (putative c-di-GMP-specific phosphodiesterase class I)